MSKILNFNTIKKQTLTVILPDEDQTTLVIGVPTKKTINEFVDIKDLLTDGGVQDEALDEFYALCAKLMSKNKSGKEITAEYLDAIFDIEDLIIFVKEYASFIKSITNQKN